VISLTADIRTRWTIPDARIIGHSDLAPERKQDPGERFPWKRLAGRATACGSSRRTSGSRRWAAALGSGDEGLGVMVLRAGLHRLGYGAAAGRRL
jgi:N-acetylmuramoyl-L-alanine amidase